MPKKISTNTKSLEARERKAAVKNEKVAVAEKQKEDAKWIDDDKSLARKQERKAEEERKKAEQLKKKADAKVLLDKELEEIAKTTVAKVPQAKLTRAQIEQEVEKRNKNIEMIQHPPKKAVPKVQPLEENFNRMMFDVHVAETVEQAIQVLNVKDSTEEDRHPEKRMKAAFKAYEDDQMPIMKAQNPTLKLSQLKQLIFKNWQKSPENPMNKAI